MGRAPHPKRCTALASMGMPEWSLLTSHAGVLMCIAKDLAIRLRGISTTMHTTERTRTLGRNLGRRPWVR
jgi:hypothetical protein